MIYFNGMESLISWQGGEPYLTLISSPHERSGHKQAVITTHQVKVTTHI